MEKKFLDKIFVIINSFFTRCGHFYLQTWFASFPDEIVLHFVQPGRIERFAGSGMVITMSFLLEGVDVKREVNL